MSIILGALAQGLLWSIMAIGIYITYRILDIADLTAEGCFTLGASVVAHFVTKELGANSPFAFLTNPFVAIFLAIIAGMIAGTVTGLLHTKLKIPALIAGILTMTGLYSINLKILGQPNVAIVDDNLDPISVLKPLQDMGMSKSGSACVVGFITVAIVILLLWLFFNTELGYTLRATGNNTNMVRALGVDTDNMKILGFVIGNGLIGLSAALISQFNGAADVSIGIGTIVIGLSSVIIGEVLFCFLFEAIFKVRSILISFISVVLGSILYRFIIAVVLKLGFPTNDLKLFSSLILAFALAFPILKKKIGGAINAKNI